MEHFNLTKSYIITSANTNWYENPILHPTRIMEEYDLIYILNGEWEIGIENKIYYLKPNDLIILPPNKLHKGISPCSPKTKTMYIHVLPLNIKKDKLISINTLTNCAQKDGIRLIFENIITTFWSKNKVKDIKLQALFELLLCTINEISEYTDKNFSDIVNKALQLIYTNPKTFYTLPQMSKILSVSPKTLSIYFKKQTGFTFHNYLTETKLNNAKAQLIQFPEMKIKQVAKNFGFYDEFHFSRQFKKKFNISPSDYRKTDPYSYKDNCL